MKPFALATALASALALALILILILTLTLTLTPGGALLAQAPAQPGVQGSPQEPVRENDARSAPALPGLADLEKTTFACPKAALNAAAREAAAHKSIGTYQFSYFNIVSASHHAAYEIHFTSNYNQEPVLKYCVALYCQQGFDPSTAVTVMDIGAGKAGKAGAAMSAHVDNPCAPPKPTRRRGGP